MHRFFALLFLGALAQSASAQVTFQQIPGLAFFDSQGYLNGVSWVDVDNDDDLDVCVTGSGGTFPNFTNISAIYLNNGNETFTNTGLLNSVQKNAFRHGWADYNNDGNLDLYIGATWNSNGINELWTNERWHKPHFNAKHGRYPERSPALRRHCQLGRLQQRRLGRSFPSALERPEKQALSE